MKLVAPVIVALLAVVGCDKGTGTDSTKTAQLEASRVQLSPDEVAMLASLPAGNIALFGGNYLRFQKYLSDSPLNRLMGALTQSTGTGMTEWMNCFVEANNVKMLGAVKLDATHVDMRFVMTGMELSQLEACAKRAGFPSTMDADHKFVGLEFPNPQGPMKGGYLAVGGGILYSRVSMQFPVTGAISIDRAALEGDIASIAKVGSAATDKVLVSQIGAVDRLKAIWFVGSAAGTPVADKVGTAHGTFDIGNGFAFDVTVQVLDKTLANRIADGVPKAKQQAGSLGGPLKSVVDKLEFNRSGDRLQFRLAIDNGQLSALVDQLAPFMQGMGGGQ